MPERAHEPQFGAQGGQAVSPPQTTCAALVGPKLVPESKCDKYRWIVRVQRGHVHAQGGPWRGAWTQRKDKLQNIGYSIMPRIDPFEKNIGFLRFLKKMVWRRLANTGATNESCKTIAGA